MFEEIDEIPGEGGLVGEKFLDSISGPSDLVVNNSQSHVFATVSKLRPDEIIRTICKTTT